IVWYDNITKEILTQKSVKLFAFETAQYDDEKDFLPFHTHQVELGNQEIVSVDIINLVYEEIADSNLKDVSGLSFIKNEIDINFFNAISQKINYGVVSFVPIRYNKNRSKYERVISYQMELGLRNINRTQKSTSRNYTNSSKLS